MTEEGLAFLTAKGRGQASAIGMLDMLGKQKPEPDRPPTAVPADVASAATQVSQDRPQKRLVIAWGPREGVLMLGLEIAPDWDLTDSWMVNQSAVWDLFDILQAVVKIKDLTGSLKGARHVEPEKPARSHAKNPATRSRSTRSEATAPAPNRRRGSTDRATRATVGGGHTTDGPASAGSDASVGGSAAKEVQEA